jgi:dinuclear metal center YbgI/SA1388 family protein
MNTRDLFDLIELIAPPHMAAAWDRCGVQVASDVRDASRLAVALDPTPEVLSKALGWGAQVVLTHHPLGKTPRLPDRLDSHHAALRLLLTHRAWLFAAHTSLDCAPGGPATWLADELGLRDREIVDPQGVTPRIMGIYKEVAMDGFDALALPESLDVDRLHFDRDALRHAPQAFSCPEPQWAALGRALADCRDVSSLAGAVRLVEPAESFGFGLLGALPDPLPWEGFLTRIWETVPRSFLTLVGTPPAHVRTMAYCTGSGASLADKAFAKGADVFLTGDVTHHPALDSKDLGLTIDCGHRVLEEEMMRRLAGTLSVQVRDHGLDVRFFESADPMRAVLRPV